MIKDIKDFSTKKYPLLCPVCTCHPLWTPPATLRRYSVENPKPSDNPIDYLLFSPSRTGSTLTYQLLNHLNNRDNKDSNTVKTHIISQEDCPINSTYRAVICTVRHPHDSMASWIKINYKKDPSLATEGEIFDKFDKEYRSLLGLIVYAELLRPLYGMVGGNLEKNESELWKLYGSIPSPVFFLRYEDVSSVESRIESLSSILDKSLTQEEILRISNKFSIDNNIKRIKSGNSLKNLEISDTMGAVGEGKKLSRNILEKTHERYSEIFQWFKYESY